MLLPSELSKLELFGISVPAVIEHDLNHCCHLDIMISRNLAQKHILL